MFFRALIQGLTKSAAFTLICMLTQSVFAEGHGCARIVSLAPSITEAVYELGLEERLVGVTSFCRYPQAAQKIEKIGGYFDVNLERIVTLKPTLVVTLQEGVHAVMPLKRFGIEVLEVDHRSIAGIKASFTQIGELCTVRERAVAKLEELSAEEHALKQRLHGVPSFATLIVVGRVHEGSALSSIYLSGRDGVYSDVLTLIGSKNANTNRTIAIPAISPEGLLSLKPEAVIEIASVDEGRLNSEQRRELWHRYPTIPAVASNRIAILTEDYASIPGPRYIQLAHRLAQALYPERF